LREAYRRTRKDAAPGADKVTAVDYAKNLESNLKSLHRQYKEGSYVAPFVRRVWIDKEDGSQRPIGIPAFEDKILQRAISMLLGAIYEIDFHDFSYGFREKRGAHGAIKEVRDACYDAKVSTIIDADVSKFFDKMPHDRIREILRLRINDGKNSATNRLLAKSWRPRRWQHKLPLLRFTAGRCSQPTDREYISSSCFRRMVCKTSTTNIKG
jgi:retron-type reverse transcriptase